MRWELLALNCYFLLNQSTGQRRAVFIQTTYANLSGDIRLIVQAQAAPIAADAIVAALEVLLP